MTVHYQDETQKVFGGDRKKGEAINEYFYDQKGVVLLEKEGLGFIYISFTRSLLVRNQK